MKNTTHLLALLLTLLLPCALRAQQLPQPDLAQLTTTGTITPAAPAVPVVPATESARQRPIENRESKIENPQDEVVHMDVFNVDASKDEGYSAFNTTSGSRINTPLRDTPASIDAFTDQFLADIGATSIEELLTYAGNFEAELGDTSDTMNNEASLLADGQPGLRIRGMTGGVSVNYGESGIPQDLYNIDRAEIASGANSILFGLGPQGGLLTLTTKRANLQRNTLRLQYIIGTWNNPGNPWNFNRAIFNYNVVLIPRAWAFGLNAVWQDGGDNSWRYWQGFHQKRINPVMTIRPWQGTTISLEYEKGRTRAATTSPLNGGDGITAWLAFREQEIAAGNPNPGVMQGFGSDYALPGTPYLNLQTGLTTIVNPANQINSGGSNPYFVFNNNNNTLYDYRQSYQSSPIGAGYTTDTRLPASISSYDYSTTGPYAHRTTNFQRWSLNIQQRLGKFNLEFSYSHNKTNSVAHSPNQLTAVLRADPNKYISSYIWGGPTAVIDNDYAGRLYMENAWMLVHDNQTNNNYRLTAETSLNTRNFGRHRFVALLERAEQDRLANDRKNEILVDQNQIAIYDPTVPNGTYNWIRRRHYLTEGDFRTYYGGAWQPPIEGITIGDHTLHSTYAADAQRSSHVRRNSNTIGLTAQSYWFSGRLVTTLGARIDDHDYRKERNSRIIDAIDPDTGQYLDPRYPTLILRDKSKVLNEWVRDGTWLKTHRNSWTLSTGAVFHATNRLSPFVNYSTNRGPPYTDGRTVLPTSGDIYMPSRGTSTEFGLIPPPSRGTNTEFGLIFDLIGNGKCTLRLTRFITRQLDDASITDNLSSATSSTLGSTNLFNIYDALHFLAITGQTGDSPLYVPGQLPGTGPWPAGTGPGMGPMSSDLYAVIPPSADGQRYPFGAPPIYNAAIVNNRTEGYELVLTANPTRNLTLRLAASYTDRQRTNMFTEIIDFYNANIPVWLAMSRQPNPVTGGPYTVVTSVNSTTGAITATQPLDLYVWQQLYGVGGVRDGLYSRLWNASGVFGNRPFKFNFTTTYTFRQGALRGMKAGGSIIYNGFNWEPDPNSQTYQYSLRPPVDTTDETLQIDPDLFLGKRDRIRGRSFATWNFWLNYRCKVLGGRSNMVIQLNIKNAFARDRVTFGRYNTYGRPTRVYINPPRSIQLTTTFEF